MMDCLYAKCIPIITDCVLAELEKLGQKYRLALRVAKDPRFERIKCDHKGTYADDCLVDRVIKHRVYIVATNDRDLKRRIRYGISSRANACNTTEPFVSFADFCMTEKSPVHPS